MKILRYAKPVQWKWRKLGWKVRITHHADEFVCTTVVWRKWAWEIRWCKNASAEFLQCLTKD